MPRAATRFFLVVLVSFTCLALAGSCAAGPAPKPGPSPEAAPVPPPGTQSLDPALDAIASTVRSRLESGGEAASGNGRKPALAVFPLEKQDGSHSVLGALLAEKLTRRLADAGLVVVERERAEYLAREIKSQFSELSDPGTTVRLGAMLGASVLLTGTVRDAEAWVDVELRLTDVETARVLGGADAKIARDEQLKPLLRQENAAGATRLDKELELGFTILAQRKAGTAWEQVDAANGSIIRNGDQLQFHLKANRDCNAYVLAYGSSGKLFMVFPNPELGHASSRIEAGRDIQIPPRGNRIGEWITIEPPVGTETFFALATIEEFSNRELARLIEHMEAAGGGLSPANSSVAVGAIAAVQSAVNSDAEFRQSVAALAAEAGPADPPAEPAAAAPGDGVGKRSATVQVFKRDLGGVSHDKVEEYSLSDGVKVQQVMEIIHGTSEAVQKVVLRHAE